MPVEPADALRREDIPAELLKAAGGGDPMKVPPEVVAILDASNQTEGKGIYSVTFSPDGKTLVSGGAKGELKLWDTATGKEVRSFTGHAQSIIWTTVFSPDGKTLAS
jgi:WD40 repeat protein